ncbi:MAG: IPT/TIG domain-containing protein [Candidatus Saccharibacteria bacterium]|nr:IPT/TIG domain-containing protein [Rhodoferax sp.]
MTISKRSFVLRATASAALLALSACGGGGDNYNPDNGVAGNLSGTAAVGSPIVGGTVKTVCAAGTAPANTTTSATGAWQVALSGQTFPCAVQVSEGSVNGSANTASYHSIALNLGTVNISPLTDLLVANLAASSTPSAWFTGLSTSVTPLATTTQSKVDAALVQLRNALGTLTPLATTNPVTTAFTAAAGNSMDDMLAALRTALNIASVSYATLLTNASQSTFTAPTGITQALTQAFAGTTTGGAVALPAVPDGVTATAISASQININWTNVSGATAYNIFRSTSPNVQLVASNKVNTGTVTTGPFQSVGLAASTPYYFKITAANAAGESAGSIELTTTTPSAAVVTPVVTDISPVTGPAGTVVTITGTSFSTTAANNVVTFNGVAATVTNATATQLTVSVPATASTGTITVSVRGQTATAATVFTVSTSGTGGGTAVGTQMGGSRQGVAVNIASGAGMVTTFAGSGTDAGTNFFPNPADAVRTAATFSTPTGLTTDGVNLYVADYNNGRIRKIVLATGAVTTVAGGVGIGTVNGTGLDTRFSTPSGITTDGTNLYVVDQFGGNVRKIVIATGVVSTLASVGGYPYGITTDGVNLYISELQGNKIDKVAISTGVVSVFAGSGAFTNISTDGTGTGATFVTPAGLTTDGTNLYVAEAGAGKIRKIVIATGVVTTLAGQSLPGAADGTGTAAQFRDPYDVTTDGTNLFVADSVNRSVRKVVIATGVVTTLAGSGASGSADGTGAAASFGLNRSIVTDGVSLYVGDNVTHTIRKIQ